MALQDNTTAPDFELAGLDGAPVRLCDLLDERHVVLVFNRGLT